MSDDAYLVTYESMVPASGIQGPLHEAVHNGGVILIARPRGQKPQHFDPAAMVRAYIERLCMEPSVDPAEIRVWKLTPVRVREERSISIKGEL